MVRLRITSSVVVGYLSNEMSGSNDIESSKVRQTRMARRISPKDVHKN